MKLSHQTVGEVMHTEVTTIREDATVRDLARLLSREGIGGAPVVDTDDRVVGVVSATDVLALAAREPATGTVHPARSGPGPDGPLEGYYEDAGGPHPDAGPLVLSLVPPAWLDDRTVGDIMSRTRHAVRPKTSLDDLARLFLRTGIHRALVMDDGGLVGIVTTFDVLRCLVGSSETFERTF